MTRNAARKIPATENRGPFGAPAADPRNTVSTVDAVRRARWIALDMNASWFGLFLVGPPQKRARLLPFFDTEHPRASPVTRAIALEERSDVIRHVGLSTVPLCWSKTPGASAEPAWCQSIAPLVAGTTGIAFPVQAGLGGSGLFVLLGDELTTGCETLFSVHARCFALFEAVSQARGGEGVPRAMSKRELECLKLTANGYTSEAIASALKLSVHTANQYLTNTTQKLDAANRVHAVAKALRLGLIE